MTVEPDRPLICLDVETGGLDLERHDVFEIAWWDLSTGERQVFLPWIGDGRAFLAAADLAALRINRFVDRWTPARLKAEGYSEQSARMHLASLVSQIWPDPDDDATRAVMVCAQPKFDLPFVAKTLAAHDIGASWADRPTDVYEPWHYRAIDFSSYGAGVLGLNPRNPDSASSLAARLGVSPPTDGRHTALGDVVMTGRAMLLLMWIQQHIPRYTLGDLDRIVSDAPQGEEIDKLAG